ncbi:hypothetical protein VOLCADRAFT_69193 [Volvox carteri f. nagariensis]|uniref:Endoplasmic reticulum vesicle transporter C-terminal domain-containing protein n=1 Tax=Volvox carteri f. nagariensis TaxID=3068 RepID=D8UHV8_VOLCA|nr:uncharacterized protein VOLCADRAFT_69193 [Volvox carteri f. nagariensis]EFJ40687.1 hypothetical protein VOLCADRAFT_69193 [Volvox carteri f. nagariensis]|eukprot:XP_002958233.1 hypothetical protein VOLCADRAFT_69193 [Volvox carteri f. nagariensis]
MKFKLSSLSAYVKPEAHLVQQTVHGALVTLCGILLAAMLFVHELGSFYRQHRVTQMSVDLARRNALTINIDLTFPAIPCAVLSIDVLDIAGTAENDASYAHHMHIHKLRLDGAGKPIGKAEYHTPQSQQIMDTGAEQLVSVNIQEAMQHLVDMEEEAEHHEGCHVYGTMDVKRVAGRLHFSVHQNMVFQMLPQLLGAHRIPKVANISHTIKHLGFGPHYPGQLNPLDGYVRMVKGPPQSFKYFLKVVPTEYYNRLGRVTETHQYSVTEYTQPLEPGYVPTLDVHYDLSPIVMTINERPPSLLHFVVRLCAVVGGAFAITRMTDRWVDWFVRLVTKLK